MVLWFWTSFVVTLALFGGAAWTGLRHRRRAHFIFAPLAVASLTITVLLTEQLARAVEFPKEEMKIHLACAKTAAALLLPVLLTGFAMTRTPRARIWHRTAVIVFVLAVLVATGTGIWVFSLSVPR